MEFGKTFSEKITDDPSKDILHPLFFKIQAWHYDDGDNGEYEEWLKLFQGRATWVDRDATWCFPQSNGKVEGGCFFTFFLSDPGPILVYPCQ